MKKIILEEISRISEIMGIKNPVISEQWYVRLANKLVGGGLGELQSAASRILGKTISKVDDLSERELLIVMKGLQKGEAKAFKNAIVNSISDEIGMTISKFESKTADELAEELLNKGFDEETSGLYLRWFMGKNKVRPKSSGGASPSPAPAPHTPSPAPHTGGGTGGGILPNLPTQFDIDDLMAALKSEPGFSDIIKSKSAESKLRQFIETEMRVKNLTAEQLWINPQVIREYLQRAKQIAKEQGVKSDAFFGKMGDILSSIGTKRGAKIGLGILISLLLARVITVKQLQQKAKEIIGTDEKPEDKKPEEKKSKKKITDY